MQVRFNIPKLSYLLALLASGFLFVWPDVLQAQHIHVNAGAISTTQDAQLYFPNGYVYDTNALYDVYLTFTNSGSFSNLYQAAGVTFTALASTPDNGGPAFGHAADGAFLQLQFISMSGPPSGEFTVWIQDVGNPANSHPLFTLPVGTNNGTNLLALSESDGSYGSDPYGHIHGRTFTTTRPGLYTLGCRILDTSANGAGSGPIHTPSALYYLYFQAGLTISSCGRSSNTFTVTFGTTGGKTYYVESTTKLAPPSWTTFAGPFAGNNYLQTASTNSAAPNLFIRVSSN
jgi:hypothetical protein